MENSINKILDTVKKNISSKEYDLAIENLKKVIQIILKPSCSFNLG